MSVPGRGFALGSQASPGSVAPASWFGVRRPGSDEALTPGRSRLGVSEDVPDRSPTTNLLVAVGLVRNAKRGVVVGALFALSVYLARVLELWGPFRGTREYPVIGPEGWFLLLAFVLASATAMLVTAALTVVSAYRMARAE